jgi:hypothetical protein
VIEGVEEAPAHWDGSLPCLAHAIEIGLVQSREHHPRLGTGVFQQLYKLRCAGGVGGELSFAVSRGRMTPNHLTDPKVFGTRDVGRQHAQRIGGVLSTPFYGAPVQGFHGQIRNQIANLSPQIFDHPQVAIQLGYHLAHSYQL